MAQARHESALFRQDRSGRRGAVEAGAVEAGAAGSVAVERAMLLSLIAIVIIAAGQNVGDTLSGVLDRLTEAMTPVADRPAIRGAPSARLPQ